MPAPFAQRSLLIRFICANTRFIFQFVGRGLAPAAVLFGQSGTPVPTVRKRAFMSSRTQKAFQARRGKSLHTPKSVASVTRQVFSQTLKRCGRDAVKLHTYPKSVAGSGTQPQVSRRLFCFFFLRLKKEDTSHSRGQKSLQPSDALRRHLSWRARL